MRLPPYLSLYITGAVALLVEMPMSVVEVLNKPSGWKFNERNELISTLKLKFVLNFLIFYFNQLRFLFFLPYSCQLTYSIPRLTMSLTPRYAQSNDQPQEPNLRHGDIETMHRKSRRS